jgi:GNAT superfamily N-acetyltransferase
MSPENDVIIDIIDEDTKEKAGQLRYNIINSETEIFDTYVFPEYRRKKIMTNLVKKIIPELKMLGVTKIKLRYLNDTAREAWESMGFIKVDDKGNMELYLM